MCVFSATGRDLTCEGSKTMASIAHLRSLCFVGRFWESLENCTVALLSLYEPNIAVLSPRCWRWPYNHVCSYVGFCLPSPASREKGETRDPTPTTEADKDPLHPGTVAAEVKIGQVADSYSARGSEQQRGVNLLQASSLGLGKGIALT